MIILRSSSYLNINFTDINQESFSACVRVRTRTCTRRQTDRQTRIYIYIYIYMTVWYWKVHVFKGVAKKQSYVAQHRHEERMAVNRSIWSKVICKSGKTFTARRIEFNCLKLAFQKLEYFTWIIYFTWILYLNTLLKFEKTRIWQRKGSLKIETESLLIATKTTP